MITDEFISKKVESLFAEAAKVNGPVAPPVDPKALAYLCGVVSIDHRPMVPEGVLSPVSGGFRIFLQSNFANQPGVKLRQRFTIAHELAHTFYYDLHDKGGLPERKKGSPRGQRLERLCHIAASQILVPEPLLRREIKTKGEVTSTESILELSNIFGVSAEVLIRRLHGLGLVASDTFAAILVRTSTEGKQLIEAACYGPLLLCLTAKPKRGVAFDSWVKPLIATTNDLGASEWIHTTPLTTITAKKVQRSRHSFILDLKFGWPAQTSQI